MARWAPALLAGAVLLAAPVCDARKALGVDLGGGVLRAAVATKGGVRSSMVLNSMSERAFPSVVGWRAPGDWIDPAERMLSETAKRLAVLAPNATVQNLRDMTAHDPLRAVELYGGRVTTEPIDALAMVLRYVRSLSGSNTDGAVISVPAYFTSSERQSIADAAAIAGVAAPQLISEHAALAVAYSFIHNFGAAAAGDVRPAKNEKQAQRVMFVSLSAHGAQASLVRYRLTKGTASTANGRLIKQKVATVVATAQNTSIGVAVLQERLLQDMLAKCTDPMLTADEVQSLLTVPKLRSRLASAVRRAMEMLTSTKDAEVEIEDLLPSGAPLRAVVTRAQLEELGADVADGVRGMIRECLANVRGRALSPQDIGSVELSGGGTRIPFIQTAIAAVFDAAAGGDKRHKALSHRLDKDEAIAQGAAVAATNTSDPDASVVLLTDVSSHAYRLRVFALRDAEADILPAPATEALVDVTVKRSAPLPHRQNFDFDVETSTDAVLCVVSSVGVGGAPVDGGGTPEQQLLPEGERLEGLWIVSDFAKEAKALEADAKHQGFNVERAKHPVTGKAVFHIRGRLGIKADERVTVGRMAVVRDTWKVIEVPVKKKKEDKKKGKKDKDKDKDKDKKKKDKEERMSKKIEEIMQQALPVRAVSAKEFEEVLPARALPKDVCAGGGSREGAPRALYTELSREEVHQRQRRLQRLQMQDERRLELSSARNNLEHLLYVAQEVVDELARVAAEGDDAAKAWIEGPAVRDLAAEVADAAAVARAWAEEAQSARDVGPGDYNMHALPLQRRTELLRQRLEERDMHVDVDDETETDAAADNAEEEDVVDDVVPEFVDLLECSDAVNALRARVQRLAARLAELGHADPDE